VGCGIGISDAKAALLQVIGIVDERAADEEGGLGIHDDFGTGGLDEDIAVAWAVCQIHLVLESGAAAADDGEAQRAAGDALGREETGEALPRGRGEPNESLVAYLELDGIGHGLVR
jgi:hypothetical protein